MKLPMTLAGLMILSLNVYADIVTPLAKNDAFGKTVRAIATQLGDSNISSGTTELWAGKLKKAGEFESLLKKGFADAFKDSTGDQLPSDAELKITEGTFVDGDGRRGSVRKMTAAILESNDYGTDNEENWESSARQLWVVLRKFPVSDETLIGHVKTVLEDESSHEKRTIQYFLLVNEDKKAVQLFTIEGSM